MYLTRKPITINGIAISRTQTNAPPTVMAAITPGEKNDTPVEVTLPVTVELCRGHRAGFTITHNTHVRRAPRPSGGPPEIGVKKCM